MTNKIVAIQGNHPSKLNPKTDTSVFLANEIQKKKYRIFYYDPKDLSIVDSKVIAKGLPLVHIFEEMISILTVSYTHLRAHETAKYLV